MRARESVPVDRLAPQKPVFQHPALTAPHLPDSIGLDVHHPAMQPFVIPFLRHLISTSKLQGPWEQQLRPAQLCSSTRTTPVSLWPLNRTGSSEQRRKKPYSLFSLFCMIRPAARKSPVCPSTFPAASAPEQRRTG